MSHISITNEPKETCHFRFKPYSSAREQYRTVVLPRSVLSGIYAGIETVFNDQNIGRDRRVLMVVGTKYENVMDAIEDPKCQWSTIELIYDNKTKITDKNPRTMRFTVKTRTAQYQYDNTEWMSWFKNTFSWFSLSDKDYWWEPNDHGSVM